MSSPRAPSPLASPRPALSPTIVEREAKETDPLLPRRPIVTAVDQPATAATVAAAAAASDLDAGDVPPTAVRELATLVRLATPSVMSNLLSFSNRSVVTLVVGHLGAVQLSAATLSVMFTNVFGFSLCYGISTALDTLSSQAVTGAANPRHAGIYLQRALLINMAIAVPLTALWWWSEPVLLMLGQEVELARLSATYTRYLLPSLLPCIVQLNVAKFLQAQGLMHAQLTVMAFVFPLNVALQYALVLHPATRIGFYGAALATNVTEVLAALGLVLFATFWRGHECWHAWTRDSLHEWGTFIRLGIPGMVMMCAEWWMFECVALLAGLYGAKVLAAQAVLLNICSLMFSLFLGISIVATNRVGNFLGAACAVRARYTARMSLVAGMLVSLATSALLIATRHWVGRLYSDDDDVVALVAHVLPVCALFQFSDSGVCVAGGILRGCGRQKVGAIVNLVTYYALGLPLCWLLARYLDWQLMGIWIALAIGLLFTLAGQAGYVLFAIDWQGEVDKAHSRVNEEETGSMVGVDSEIEAQSPRYDPHHDYVERQSLISGANA